MGGMLVLDFFFLSLFESFQFIRRRWLSMAMAVVVGAMVVAMTMAPTFWVLFSRSQL